MSDAKRAITEAKTFEAKLAGAGQAGGDQLESLAKELTVELNSLSISASKKAEFRETLALLSKKVFTYKKEKAAAQTGLVVEKTLSVAAETTGNIVVCRYDFGIEGKVAKSVMGTFGKTIKDKALMLISGDESSDRILVAAWAPKSMSDLDCKALVAAVTEGTGGKGGGNKTGAQFTVPGMSHMDKILDKARSFQ